MKQENVLQTAGCT